MNKFFLTLIIILVSIGSYAEDGYELWLRYPAIENPETKQNIQEVFSDIVIIGKTQTTGAIKYEIQKAVKGWLGTDAVISELVTPSCKLVIGTVTALEKNKLNLSNKITDQLGDEGFYIGYQNSKKQNTLVVSGKTDMGVLYGTFRLLSLLNQNIAIDEIDIISNPKIKHRLLNHWDNLDRTVERGYSGFSIWNWHMLPDYVEPRYTDYARANTSIGINGTVLTNVNANALVLSTQYLKKVQSIANTLRPYGIKVYLTARFSAPIEIGNLKTADPQVKEVQAWWNAKAKEIYALIPDFGGFLVKANSEGQPGPQDYKRSHAEGANMLADAVAPYGGIVMWRAFVYSHEAPDDRAKQAYTEFKPLDGKFRDNVLVQVKNGAIDFQPREPFHPLFGATPKTPLMLELQITQEYTGCATHLFFQAPLYKEVLESDTYCTGKGATVAKVIDGSIYDLEHTGIAGVANIGNDRNWCGHPFAQANWYAFGRLGWNHALTSKQIADEWLKQTFTAKQDFVDVAGQIMLDSRETLVNYMTPLGIHHIMAWNHHYGPGPWINEGRPDWTAVYYHKADEQGIGFDRTTKGSDAVSQYFPEVKMMFNSLDSIPEKYLLWFHHVNWDYKMNSGRTLWEELCYCYYTGAEEVTVFQQEWEALVNYVDAERFQHVKTLLSIQAKEAKWWRDACLLYFQQFSKREIPEEYEKPENTLKYYINIRHRNVPGIKNP